MTIKPDEKLQEMYRREYIAEQYKGLTRFDLIERIRDLEKQLAEQSNQSSTDPTQPS